MTRPAGVQRGQLGERRRTRTVSVRLSPAEWAEWDQRRQTAGVAEMGSWVRQTVHQAAGVPLRPRGREAQLAAPVVPEANRDAIGLLSRAGNNLNQLARRLNLTGEGVDELLREQLRALVGELSAAAKALRGQGRTT